MKANLKTVNPTSVLTPKNLEDFWIRCLLGSEHDNTLFNLSIKRAYRDLNRTIHGLGSVEPVRSKNNYEKLALKVKESVLNLMSSKFESQEQFDLQHKKECELLLEEFQKLYPDPHLHFFIGQAQKWINMTLKYMYALGSERHGEILDNYPYFHFPIDNIIQEKLSLKGIQPLKTKWSRINNYADYLEYQKQIRITFKDQIPMDIEFLMFNE